MAPIKSSLVKSVGKLFGVQKDTDLSLRGDVQDTRFISIPVEASGGNITGGGGGNGFKYHVFTSPGNFTVTQGGKVEILLVGGGGPSGSTDASTTVETVEVVVLEEVVHAPAYTILLELILLQLEILHHNLLHHLQVEVLIVHL